MMLSRFVPLGRMAPAALRLPLSRGMLTPSEYRLKPSDRRDDLNETSWEMHKQCDHVSEVSHMQQQRLNDMNACARRIQKAGLNRSATLTPEHYLSVAPSWKYMHTSAYRRIDEEDATQIAANKLRQAKRTVGVKMEKAKEGAEDLWEKTKDKARHAKDIITEAATVPVPPSAHEDNLASDAFTPSDRLSTSNPVRAAASSESLSTTAGRQRSWTVGDPEEVASGGSLWEGPQEMPQGPGKRARDADGKPMEPGADKA